MYGKSNMETYITICKIDSQRELAVWLSKLKQMLCINLEEWDREGDMREFQKGGDICIPTLWKEKYDQPRRHIKKQRHYFANRGPSGHGYGFSSGHVWM